MVKTREELENELELVKNEAAMDKKLKCEREVSDKSYAIKLVEKIVFALVSLLLIAVIGAMIKLVIVQ